MDNQPTDYPKTEEKAGKAHVEAEKVDNLKEAPPETLVDITGEVGEPRGFTQPVCQVNYSVGHTKNLGNYESLKTMVSLTMPCYPHEIEDIGDYCRKWVFDRMEALQDELDAEINSDD
jgi:hypothetical protein